MKMKKEKKKMLVKPLHVQTEREGTELRRRSEYLPEFSSFRLERERERE